MIGIIDALYNVKYNPFEYGAYVASFYSGISNVENDVLLAPLIIPLCSHPFFSIKLGSINKKSSMWTVFNGRTKIEQSNEEKYRKCLINNSKNQIIHSEQIYDLQDRIDKFKILTKQSIQYCLVNDWLFVEENKMKLQFNVESKENLVLKSNAVKLGKLLSNQSVTEIYAMLGVKSL